jgi:4-amino-4-deoxy-L-arabinose transferase-like glycosyltransferase
MPATAVTPSRAGNVWIIAGLWLFLYASFALLSPPLLDDADSVHAEVAREMIVRGDPITLYANGIRYLEKAPLLYWSMAVSMRAFGVGTAAARLPLALYALLLFLLVEHFARRAFRSDRAGLYAGAGLLLSFGLFIFTRMLIPDAIVCLWLTAAIFCFWLTETGLQEYSGKAPLWPCLGFGAACALNILTKGLIGLVFPLGTVLLYLLMTRGVRGTLRRISQFHVIASTAVFLVIAAPWHVEAALANPTEGRPVGLTHPGGLLPWFWRGWQVGQPAVGSVHGWTWFYFMNEHLLRYLNLRVPRDYDTVPLLLFWGLVVVWMLPWSAFLFKALGAVPWLNTWSRKPLDAEDKILLLLGIAALLPLLFFSLSTRQEYYVLPSLPFFAMLIARWLDREALQAESMAIPAPLPLAGQRIATFLLVCGALAAMVCAFLLLHTKAESPTTDLSSLLQQNPGEYALSFGHFLDLNTQAMSMFRQPLLLVSAAFFLGALGNWRARRNYQPHRGNIALAVGTLVFLTAAHMSLTIFSPVLSSQRLAAAIAPQLRPSNLLVINDEYEAGSTLGFYLGRSDVHILHGHSSNLWYGSFFTDAPPIFETDESIQHKWARPERIFMWTDPTKVPALPSKVYVIAEGGGKEIVSNRQSEY